MNQALQKCILDIGFDDWMYLAEVVQLVRADLKTDDLVVVMPSTISLIGMLVCEKLVIVGNIPRYGRHFLPWLGSIEAISARIRRDWLALGRELIPGDVSWLCNTAHDDEVARSGIS